MRKDFMQELAVTYITEEEYLTSERYSEDKHEYYRGEIFAMTGASERHNLIELNAASELRVQLKKTPCRVYPSDMRLKIHETGLYTYPDVMIVCGKREFVDDKQDMITNPDVIIEVLSDSTEKYDRGKKFGHYRKLESLKEYIMISQHERRIEKYLRNNAGFWIFTESDEEHPLMKLESVPCTLDLSEVYDKVE
jgi:Uma2 family endonuclease